MTETFRYEELTWPEVAALPRDTPLVIPLGEGYPLSQLISALGHPPRIGMLPPLPFGWQGSGLAVQDNLLADVLHNLLDSLREDGFSRPYVLTPQGLNLGLGPDHIALPHPGQFRPALPLPPEVARDKVVLLPIGHTEQHGHHLPLSTDTQIISAISSGVQQAVPEQAITLPAMPYGVSTHRASFAGTLNCGGRAFEDFWLGVIAVLQGRGFDRFYLLSGHGGNCSFLVNVAKYAGERHRRIFCATAWLYLSGPDGAAALSRLRRSPRGGMGHAGELETALMCHLQPGLVRMDRAIDEVEFIATPSYFMDWAEGGTLIANPPWDDDTATGAYGAGSLATPENGALWLQAAIDEKIAHVAEIHDQQARREARRAQEFGLWGKGLA